MPHTGPSRRGLLHDEAGGRRWKGLGALHIPVVVDADAQTSILARARLLRPSPAAQP